LRIVPLSFDSMGVRSMSTYVETKDVRILIDPGVALAPIRYGLPPHSKEIERMEESWKRIAQYSEKADVLAITHYHYDHHNPDEPQIFEGKTVLVKDPRNFINRSQMERAAYFLGVLKGKPRKVEVADGNSCVFGDTKIQFSKPVFHGTNSRLGYVVEVLVEEGEERFLHTSDVEGPPVRGQAGFMLECNPTILFVDGPVTYMLGYKYSVGSLRASVNHLIEVMKRCDVKRLVLDHHLLRDTRWRDKVDPLFPVAEERGARVETAAEFAGKEAEPLEARRRELYEEYPERPLWRFLREE